MLTKQKFLNKVKPNKKFWYIENHVKVIEGIHIGFGLAMINGKLENMNPKMMVYTKNPKTSNK